MHKSYKWKNIAGIFLAMLFLLAGTLNCAAYSPESASEETEAYYYQNEENGNYILVDDEANLLTQEQKDQLYYDMYDITDYGHVGFVTITADYYSTVEEFAKYYYQSLFDHDSGIIFLIDMDKRKVCIFSDGSIYNTITRDYADSITDNVYTYAKNQDYYGCASTAFAQILTVLQGGKIAQPMKYICNFLLAVIFAMLLIYFYVRMASTPGNASDKQLMSGMISYFEFRDATKNLVGQSKRYSPRSSGGGGSSSGGGGGGSSSGGGGSHSF